MSPLFVAPRIRLKPPSCSSRGSLPFAGLDTRKIEEDERRAPYAIHPRRAVIESVVASGQRAVPEFVVDPG